MLLAGGRGSRLGSLTKKMAKPAVPFGGKYRLIDFPLSNCTNSGIDTVGVLTQYQPHALHSYLGTGSTWDLHRKHGGLTVLSPYSRADGGHWYKGTANAIYQNIDYIASYNPRYVLILSADHIYKMDYRQLINYHKVQQAAVTIGVIEVPLEQASQFGIMKTDASNRIIEFEEKPEVPKSNLASMGVYVFNWDVLEQWLRSDEENTLSQHDFGKDIIPTMLEENVTLSAYTFSGYWQDVGTISSLWEANMDLLTPHSLLKINDSNWRIHGAQANLPPHFQGSTAVVHDSIVGEGCSIWGRVEHSVISSGVYIAKGAYVQDSVILPNSYIGSNALIERSIVGEGISIPVGAITHYTMNPRSKTAI